MLQIDFSKNNRKVQNSTTSRMGQDFAGKFIIERPQLEGDHWTFQVKNWKFMIEGPNCKEIKTIKSLLLHYDIIEWA